MEFITVPSKPVFSEKVRETRRRLLEAERADSRAQHEAPQVVLQAASAMVTHAKKCKKEPEDCRLCGMSLQMHAMLPPTQLSRVLEQPMPTRRWNLGAMLLSAARDRATDGSQRSAADMHLNAQLFAGFKDRHPAEFKRLSA